MQTPEAAVYRDGVFLGYMADDEIRHAIRNGKGSIQRKGNDRRFILHSVSRAATGETKESFRGGTAMRATQREEIYQGQRFPGKRLPRTDGPVTAVLTVLRKVRDGEFMNWGESDKFPRRRFNPDQIPAPRFRTVREFRDAQNGNSRKAA